MKIEETMFQKEKNLAIIPARSGSKGLKDKNIKDLCGKPLIAYTIEAATSSKMFEDIIVSTDSELYASIAKKFNAQVPFLRSEENSSDNAGSWAVVKEVLERLDKEYDTVALLQPTSPFRTDNDIINAYKLFAEKNADFVVSVCPFAHSVAWINTIKDDLCLDGFIKKEYLNKRRQDILPHYTLNGAIYIAKTKKIDNNPNLFTEKSFAYVMNEKNSIDIDSELDFIYAEALMSKNLIH